MEERIQTKPCKFFRVGNGKIGQYPDDDEDGERKRSNLAAAAVGGGDSNRLHNWHHSSRIIRVSRASGGKDRHSKVWTSKGLRDRRVRLSVTTAIQFYDLQDRLGFDQPSKAIEWLIKAAADSINELPELNVSFVDDPKQFGDEKRIGENVEQGLENQSQHFSGCSSTSDTSKGSGLSLSRSDVRVNRVKARERARERAAKEKEKDGNLNHQNVNPNPQNSSFTELLTSGINSSNNNNDGEANLFHNKGRQWPWIAPMDCFSSGQIQLGNSISQPMAMSVINSPFSFSGENQQQQEQLQHFPFFSDHLIPVGAAGSQQQGPGGDYNLNFTISSGLAGFNRGTLQSNSSQPNSLLPNLQRFSSSSAIEASTSTAFFFGENHHHQFPPGQQLYGDGSSRHSDHTGKGKN